jgi:hypothetical protein
VPRRVIEKIRDSVRTGNLRYHIVVRRGGKCTAILVNIAGALSKSDW